MAIVVHVEQMAVAAVPGAQHLEIRCRLFGRDPSDVRSVAVHLKADRFVEEDTGVHELVVADFASDGACDRGLMLLPDSASLWV